MDSYGGLPADVQQQRSCFYDLELSDIISLSGLSELTSPVAKESPVCSQRQSSRLSQHDATAEDDHQSHELQMTERPQKRRNRPARKRHSSEKEKRRREKIEAKIKLLRQLIPNSEKLDKASLLDKAIYYMKALKWQLQVMQAMRRVPLQFVPPSGMLHCPAGTTEQLSLASRTKPVDVRLRAAMINPDMSTTIPPFFGPSSLPPAAGYHHVSTLFPVNTPYLNWPTQFSTCIQTQSQPAISGDALVYASPRRA